MSSTLEYKEIPGWEGLYGISKDGIVWSYRRGKIKAPCQTPQGYMQVTLYPGAVARTVHSLVMEVFLGPRPEGLVVNHLNGVKNDNRLENLEYCTYKENRRHAIDTGLLVEPFGPHHTPWANTTGDSHPVTIWDVNTVKTIREMKEKGIPPVDIRKAFPLIPKCTFYSFLSGRRK